MKITIIRKLMAIALIGLFSQFSLAQDAGAALKDIADIVASMNHFASDADKAKLMVIAENGSYPQGVRDMATTVTNIAHAANADGKDAMARIVASDQAPDSAKTLAGVIAGFNHMASAEEKSSLAALFP
jgi:hypothetical protein